MVKNMKIKISESEILNAVCEYLTLKHYTFWRSNNVPIYDPRKKIFRRMPKYSMKGVSDIILLLDGTAWLIEVKTEKGVLSEHQKIFKALVEKRKCIYLVVKSVDDLIVAGF